MNSKERKTKPVPAPRLRFPGFTGEWEEKTGGQLFNQISNKKHNSDLPILAITQDRGAIPRSEIDYYVSVTNESVDNYKVVEVDDFIISLRSFQGGIEYSRYKGICSPAYVIMRATKEAAIVYFQHYFKYAGFIKDLTKNLEGLRDGKMISYKQFSEVPIPLPPSLPEQTRIAAALSSLDAVIAAHQSKQDALREHKRGLMAGLFPAEGERVPRLRFPEFEGAGEWEEKRLGDEVNIFSGDAPGTLQVAREGHPYIKVEDLNNCGKYQYQSREYVKSSKNPVPSESIIFPKRGAAISSNKIRIAKKPFYMDSNMMAIKPRESEGMDIEFIFYSLNYLGLSQIADTSTIPQINNKHINAFILPLPSLPEQARIATALSSLDDLITAQGDNIAALQTFKRGLMQGLFPRSGEE